LDQSLAAVSGHGHSHQARRARHESRRRRDEVALLECQLRRHALRWIAICHDRSLLYADADGEPGPDYIVWDKAATIHYKKPGKGKVRAEFRLSDSQIDDIREKLETLPKYEPIFSVEVRDESGVVIAEVEKVLHVRKKKQDGK
jgi:hypothetical protein